jgi:hypothetical protein
MFAAAGSTSEIIQFVEWMQRGGERPEFDKEEQLTALWVKSDGSLWLCNYRLHFYQLHEDFFAIGSPNTFMMGALYAGASAEEAVRLAILHTDGAGGDVQVERLLPNEPKPETWPAPPPRTLAYLAQG